MKWDEINYLKWMLKLKLEISIFFVAGTFFVFFKLYVNFFFSQKKHEHKNFYEHWRNLDHEFSHAFSSNKRWMWKFELQIDSEFFFGILMSIKSWRKSYGIITLNWMIELERDLLRQHKKMGLQLRIFNDKTLLTTVKFESYHNWKRN